MMLKGQAHLRILNEENPISRILFQLNKKLDK